MSTNEHLTLHLCRLKPTEVWANEAEGLHFVFLTGGAGECACGRSTWPLVSGDVLVLRGGTGCRLSPVNGAEIVFLFFSACLEHLFPLFVARELGFVQSLMDVFTSPRLYRASGPAATRWHELVGDVAPQSNLEHRGQLLKVAAAILAQEFKTVRHAACGYVRAVERANRTFEELTVDEILSLSVPELAARFHCCPRQLNRLFHAHFGLPVGALRMEMRLLKAVSLLRNRDFKICDVAEQCGFNHLGLFSMCFRRRFGVSPSQWRKNFIGPENPPPALDTVDPNCRLRAHGLCPWSDGAGRAKPVGWLAGGMVRRWPEASPPVASSRWSVVSGRQSIVSNP
jgi:AraC-like DNA-binding protein